VLRHLGTGTSTWSVPDPNVPVEDLVGVIKGLRRSSRSSAAIRALGCRGSAGGPVSRITRRRKLAADRCRRSMS